MWSCCTIYPSCENRAQSNIPQILRFNNWGLLFILLMRYDSLSHTCSRSPLRSACKIVVTLFGLKLMQAASFVNHPPIKRNRSFFTCEDNIVYLENSQEY